MATLFSVKKDYGNKENSRTPIKILFYTNDRFKTQGIFSSFVMEKLKFFNYKKHFPFCSHNLQLFANDEKFFTA